MFIVNDISVIGRHVYESDRKRHGAGAIFATEVQHKYNDLYGVTVFSEHVL